MSNIDLKMALDWPYPVAYGKENEVEADVLILGGGVAGCHAAIKCRQTGSQGGGGGKRGCDQKRLPVGLE